MTDISTGPPAPAGWADDTAVSGLAGRRDRGPRRIRPVRPGVLLAIVLAGQFMALLDASIVNVAIPSIHAGLHASGASLQLVVAGYTITYAVLLVTGARVGDILGHRRIFLAGLGVFTLASLGCGLGTSAAMLITMRFVQGAGAALMIPQVLSLIQRTYTGSARARAMTRYSAVLAGGTVVGQIVGGLLISADVFNATWRPIFLVNVPIGMALMAAGARLLPAGRGEAGRSLDLPGLLTLSPAVLALVLPLVLGQSEHWPLWGWLLLVVSALLVGAFVVVERRVAASGGSPLIPGRVLRLPGVTVAIAALFTVMALFGGFFFSLALHLQGGLGDSPLRAGLTFAPAAATFGLVSLNWRRVPAALHDTLIISGAVAEVAGLLWLAWVLRHGSAGGVATYLAAGLIGLGTGALFSPLMTRVLIRVPVADAADATGVIVTVNQLGIVIGVATFGTLYLNLSGQLPARPAVAFLHASAHAEAVTCVALAVLAAAGGLLAAIQLRQRHAGR
jgi:MFS family permease